jgi:hypothetical protein
MVATLSLTNIYLWFSTRNKAHKYYLEYGLWVYLGWILLDETNPEWKAKSKVVLDYELKHTKKGTGQKTYLPKESTRGYKTRRGRPAWADRPGALTTPFGLNFLHCTPCSFVALWLHAPRGCTTQMFSSTPFLA